MDCILNLELEDGSIGLGVYSDKYELKNEMEEKKSHKESDYFEVF